MISKEEVKKVARLARLDITEKELAEFQKELSAILDYFELLKEVNVNNIQPTFHPTELFFRKKSEIMRKDKKEPEKKETIDELINSAPEKKGRYIKVKAVL